MSLKIQQVKRFYPDDVRTAFGLALGAGKEDQPICWLVVEEFAGINWHEFNLIDLTKLADYISGHLEGEGEKFKGWLCCITYCPETGNFKVLHELEKGNVRYKNELKMIGVRDEVIVQSYETEDQNLLIDLIYKVRDLIKIPVQL